MCVMSKLYEVTGMVYAMHETPVYTGMGKGYFSLISSSARLVK